MTVSRLRKCVALNTLHPTLGLVKPGGDIEPYNPLVTLDPNYQADADYARPDVQRFFGARANPTKGEPYCGLNGGDGTETGYVRVVADWVEAETEDPRLPYKDRVERFVAYMHALDTMILQAKQQRKIVVLQTGSYPSWVNNTWQLDPRYTENATNDPYHLLPPDKQFNPELFNANANSHDRRRGTTFKDARWRFPGSAVVNGQYSYEYDVKPGSNWYNWIKFLLARYHRDARVYEAASLPDRYRGNLGLSSKYRTAVAYIDYFEFLNEPNGPQGWPQQGPDGSLLVAKIVADMFRSAKAASLEVAEAAVRASGQRDPVRGATLLGPSPTDDSNGDGRIATTVKTFTNAVLAELYPRRGRHFNASDPRALFIWSQHNYGDIERERYTRWRGGRVNVNTHNHAAMARDILLARKWNGLRDRGRRDGRGVRGPWVYLTEGGARRDVLEDTISSDEEVLKEQARRLGRNWDMMSNRTTGARLGLGIGMLTNFLFYDNPEMGTRDTKGLNGNRSGLVKRLEADANGFAPPPADCGRGGEQIVYHVWAEKSGKPTPRHGAP